jgi:hypothetical protein
MARMGVSTLHRQFRSLTTMSPLQFQKQHAIACGQRTDAARWNGRSKRRLRSRLRKREPVQSGIQQILRPAADARYKKPASRGFYFEKLV